MDGHASHYSLELLEYARDIKIVILGYLPHRTHVLQGLDVVCFSKMKTEFLKEIHSLRTHICIASEKVTLQVSSGGYSFMLSHQKV